MATLEIFFLGDYRILWNKTPLQPFPTKKARGVFAYLLSLQKRSISRTHLAGVFWPEFSEARAHRNLNTTLWRIRQVLPEGYIKSDCDMLRFDWDGDYWYDGEVFLDSCTHYDLSDPEELARVEAALQLYRGDFLAGFYEDWALLEVEQYRLVYLNTLYNLIDFYAPSNLNRALDYGQRFLAVDPLREDVHRRVMDMLRKSGQLVAALNQYDTCRRVLESELGVEPSLETRRIFEQVRDAQTSGPSILSKDRAASPFFLNQDKHIPLVGRHVERAQILARLDNLQEQGGEIVFLEGEAGVGKTRLLNDIAEGAQWRGIHVFWGHCRDEPYAPLIEILQSCLTPLRLKQLKTLVDETTLFAVAQLIPDIRGELELPDALHLGSEARQAQLHQALIRVLDALATISAHIFIIEDWHRMETATLAFLQEFAQTPQLRGLLIFGSGRSAETRDRKAVWNAVLEMDRLNKLDRVELPRLSLEELFELISSAVSSKRVDRLFIEKLFEKSLGNPLFALEILRTMIEQGIVSRNTNGLWQIDPWREIVFPEAAQDILSARLNSLAATERHLLHVAAVIGNSFDFDLWHNVLSVSESEFLAGSSELLRRQFIYETSQGYRFAHDLIRETAFDALSPSERIRLHGKVGLALERDGPQDLNALGLHFYAARKWDKAFHYGRLAGEQALLMFAADSAVGHFTRALRALDEQPSLEDTIESRVTVLLRRAAAYRFLGLLDERLKDVETLVALENSLDDQALKAEIFRCQADYYLDAGDHGLAKQIGLRALEISAPGGDSVLRAEIHASLGSANYALGDYQQAYDHFRLARDIFREREKINRQGRMIAAMGLACIPMARFLEARDCSDDALAIYTQTGDKPGQISALSNLGMLHGHAGLYRQALDYFRQGVEISREIRDVRQIANLQRDLAVVLREIGAYEEAEASLKESLAISREIGWRRKEGLALVTLGDLRFNQAEYDEAIAIHEKALELNRSLGLNHFIFRSHWTLTRVCLAKGDRPQKALEHAKETLRASRVEGLTNDYIYAHSIMALALLANGRKAEALAHSQKAMTRFERDGYVEEAEEEIIYAHFLVLQALGRECEAHEYITYAHNRIQQKALLLGGAEAEQYISRPMLNREIAADFALREGLDPGCRRFYLSSGEEVIWTIDAGNADKDILAGEGKAALRRVRLQRLFDEAKSQGVAPTQSDLASALGVSIRTIRKDLNAS